MLRMSCLCIATLLACGHANAGLDGNTVTVNYLFPDRDTVLETKTVLVGPGNEVTFFNGALKIDLSDEQVKMRWLTNGILSPTPFHGLQFHIDGSFGAFTAASVNAASTSGTLIKGVSFDDRNLYVNWSGVRQGDIAKFIVDLKVSPVPEPSIYALFAVGLGAVGAAARRRVALRLARAG